MEIKRSIHPADVRRLTTDELRDRFLIETIFRDGEVNLTYAQDDRMIAGGVVPLADPLVVSGEALKAFKELFDRREFGVINLGGPGTIAFGDESHAMAKRDGLYIGAGQDAVTFTSDAADNPARFYLASTPSHRPIPTAHIPFTKTRPVDLGAADRSNVRTIHQYIHPAVCESAQLLMGMTILESGSLWNTMPCHLHDRRMEIYFYFDLDQGERVFHMMGEPEETRHVVVGEAQGVVAPSWSIHTGVGTSNYSFIWAMAGENQVFEDMDGIATGDLR